MFKVNTRQFQPLHCYNTKTRKIIVIVIVPFNHKTVEIQNPINYWNILI